MTKDQEGKENPLNKTKGNDTPQINRGVELSSDVADSEHSIILNQVENGVAIRMAILYLLGRKIKK